MRTGSAVRRRWWVLTTLCALTFGAVIASLAFGSRAITPAEIWGALFAHTDSDNATVITSQRAPRTWLGLVAGAALGIAGALMQGHTRNPLADPGLFGVTAGATFAIALAVFTADLDDPRLTVGVALVGAGIVSTAVLVLGIGAGRTGGVVLMAVLGTTISSLLAALTTALILIDRQTLDTLRFWELGAIDNREFDLLGPLLPLFALGAAAALANSISLTALGLGDDVAQSLGHHVLRSRITGIVAITLLAGSATALCGPISFLGLVAPHAARLLARTDYRWIVVYSGLIGASVLLVADTIGRVSLKTGELEAGLVTAAIGAPVLLVIARRKRVAPL
ncbi:MAG: iron ABC transporter permease [Aeromicrobium sp.]|uniref:FecCD family ABC transporter permease n=1 Tax=Aeromicrobium sp. TaxID=1871063 RepID=UPI0039E57CDA